MKTVLIVGHGSRSEKFQNDFMTVIDLVKNKMKGTAVYGASMELCNPSIEDTVERIVRENESLKELSIVPFFLFEGIHIKEDIPKKIVELKIKYPNINFTFGRPIGADPLLADILVKRVEEVFN